MKANEFVKKFGWEHTKYLLEDTELSEFAIHSNCAGKYFMDTVHVSDLKRLVESHELVEKFGGIIGAKEYLKGRFIQYHMSTKAKLKQAIADVESCQ